MELVKSTVFRSKASASFTRPANTTQYTAGDLVANNATAGSVTPMELSVAREAAGSVFIKRVLLRSTGTAVTDGDFIVHFFTQSPTVANGDNAAFSCNKSAYYLGSASVVYDQVFTDGVNGATTTTFTGIDVKLDGGRSVYALIEANDTYTPASGEVFTLTVEVIQD